MKRLLIFVICPVEYKLHSVWHISLPAAIKFHLNEKLYYGRLYQLWITADNIATGELK